MSAPSGGGGKKSKARRLAVFLILLGFLGFGGAVYAYYNLPSHWREEWVVDRKLDQMHLGNLAKLRQETKPGLMKKWVKDVDVASFTREILPSATRSAQLDNAKAAWKSRATGRIPIVRENIISGVQKGWREKFVASEPLLVTFSSTEVMCSKARTSECWGVDGIYQDGTPKWRRGNKTVLQDPSPEIGGDLSNPPGAYGAVVIRTCVGGYCSGPAETGRTFAACPINGRSTTVMLWTNRYTSVGPLRTKQDFNGTNDFSFEVTPDDPRAIAACASNPSAGFVRLESGQATN